MANKTDLIAENKLNIRKNRRKIFELDAEVSTTYAELMLLLADIEENRALLQRNYTSAFMGNRSIAIDNVNDLYSCRIAMLEALDPSSDVEANFKVRMLNQVRIEQLEKRSDLNDTLRDIAAKMIEVNVMLQSVNELITEANETVVDEGDTMISENAEWADGSVAKQMTKATPNANSQSVSSNTERLQKLLDRATIAEKEATGLVHRVEEDTKGILELGDDIASRRERIQADRERVVANQRRTYIFLFSLLLIVISQTVFLNSGTCRFANIIFGETIIRKIPNIDPCNKFNKIIFINFSYLKRFLQEKLLQLLQLF